MISCTICLHNTIQHFSASYDSNICQYYLDCSCELLVRWENNGSYHKTRSLAVFFLCIKHSVARNNHKFVENKFVYGMCSKQSIFMCTQV